MARRAVVLPSHVVQGCALDRVAPRLPDETHQVGAGDGLRGVCASHVIDLLFLDRPVQVIHTEAERDLGGLDAHHDPVGLDVGDVVKHEPPDGVGAEVVDAGGRGQLAEGVVFGVVGQGDKSLEAAGLGL